MSHKNRTEPVVNPEALAAIRNAWRVLHVAGVSLAEVGRYWAIEGEDVGRKGIVQVFQMPTIRGLLDAGEELRTAIGILAPEVLDDLETESEHFKYWDGPDSPNEAPVLSLVTKPLSIDDDDDPAA